MRLLSTLVMYFGCVFAMDNPSFAMDNPSFAMDNPSFAMHTPAFTIGEPTQFEAPHLHKWFEGKKLYCLTNYDEDPYPAVLCTDESFRQHLEELNLDKFEAWMVQNLFPIDYTHLPILHAKEFIHDQDWINFDTFQGGIYNTPVHDQIYTTNHLQYCVGLAIWSSQATVFAHLADTETEGKMLSLIQEIPLEERSLAKVALVSGCYSKNFSRVFKFLRKSGFQDFSADVTPCIFKIDSSKGQDSSFVKVSSFTPDYLNYLKENWKVVKDIPIESIAYTRSLTINPRTQEIYHLTHDKNLEIPTLEDLNNYAARYKQK